MHTTRWIGGLVVLGGCGFGLLFLNSCATDRALSPALEIPGAHFVGNKACVDCHSQVTRVFPGNIHARVHPAAMAGRSDTACEACHGPASKHVEAGGGRGKFIINPGRDSAACLQCHVDVGSQFKMAHHHPLPEGRMNCVQCHDPHGLDILKPRGGLAIARVNESCAACHREQSRPFVFEHEALREGCTICHAPHGSPNNKLLAQRDANLCLKCHAQNQVVSRPGTRPLARGTIYIGAVDHSPFLKMGTCWTSGCHTAIHGSNINPKMFY